MLLVAVACDKTASETPAPAGPTLELDSIADLVFSVSGSRTDPQMMPLAAVQGNRIVPLTLKPDDWKKFDAKYLAPGTSYTTYRDGRVTGTVTVTRGMWSGDPLYTLAGCATPIPRAAVTLNDSTLDAFVVAQFATTRKTTEVPRSLGISADSVREIAKRIAYEAGRGAKLVPASLDSLDFRAAAIATGTYFRPTIMSSFIDPRGGDLGPGRGNTAHVFVLADNDSTGYKTSLAHVVNGDAATAEYRAFVDHLDLNGDGVDEIMIDGWHYGSSTTTRVYAWRNGSWREVFAAASSWCMDAPVAK